MLSNIFFQGISTRTLDKSEELKRTPTYFYKDLNNPKEEVPWDDIDETWVIIKRRSKEKGIISVLNKMIFLAIGKESQCDPIKLQCDVQLEIESSMGRFYLIDAMRYDKQSLCVKDLKHRLDSVPVEIYEKLNIEKRELIHYTSDERYRIREYDDLESVYMLQKLEDSYFGQRYQITYKQVVEDIVRRAGKRVIEEKQDRFVTENIEEFEDPKSDKNLDVSDLYAKYSIKFVPEMDLNRLHEFRGRTKKKKIQESQTERRELDQVKPKRFSKNVKKRKQLRKMKLGEVRDVNRYYDVADRDKD